MDEQTLVNKVCLLLAKTQSLAKKLSQESDPAVREELEGELCVVESELKRLRAEWAAFGDGILSISVGFPHKRRLW